MERDDESGIARLTLDNPARKNAYDPAMRQQLGAYLDELAYDDDIKVVVLRGEGGIFSTGADMNNAYAWYGDGAEPATERRSGAGPASGAGCSSTARRSTSTTSSSATRRSRWPRSRASPSAAASSWRSWPTSRSWPATR